MKRKSSIFLFFLYIYIYIEFSGPLFFLKQNYITDIQATGEAAICKNILST